MAGGHAWSERHVWSVGGVHGRGACVVGGMHGRGACMAGGACMVRGACVVSGGCAWPGGHVWSEGGMRDEDMAGQCAGGTHPTGMHSCKHLFYLFQQKSLC